jgi:hypothetical protein
MKPGETVVDGQGRAYQAGQLLGRGSWASSWLVRRESDEAWFVLKVPFAPGELRADAPDVVYALSREAVLEQARICEQGGAFLLRLEERVQLPDGRPGYLVPRLATSLERKLTEGTSLAALLEVLLAVTRTSRQLEGVGGVITGVHGHLKPSNVLFTERGDIVLSDVTTPAVRKLLARSGAAGGEGVDPWLPPELEGASDGAWTAVADGWSVAMTLWRAVAGGDGPGWTAAAPRGGLDKAAQLVVRERLLERMKVEASNPRFHTRLSERVAVLLARALAREVAPSPPYRFHRIEELHNRLDEIHDLVRPRVTQIGKVMLERVAAKPWFTTDEPVRFASTVGCTSGVEGHDEVGVGLALFEVDRDLRVKDVDLGYTVERHPSGRYRFAFQIGPLAPGRYRARIAFAIRESTEPPNTIDTEFQVRAAPGWVPRVEAPEAPAPLVLPTSAPAPAEDPPSVTPIVPIDPAPAAAGPLRVVASVSDDRPTGPRGGVEGVEPSVAFAASGERPTGPRVVTVERATGPRGTPLHGGPAFHGGPALHGAGVYPHREADTPTAPGTGGPPMPVPVPSVRVEPVEGPPPPVMVAQPVMVAPPVVVAAPAADPPTPPPAYAPPHVKVTMGSVLGARPDPRRADPLEAPTPPPVAVQVVEDPSWPGFGPLGGAVVTPVGPEAAADAPSVPPRAAVPVQRPTLGVPDPEPRPAAPLPGGWTRQTLPGRPLRDFDAEDPPSNVEVAEDAEEDNEPGVVERAVDLLRNDPYIAVMSGICVVLFILLAIFLTMDT